MKIIYYCQHIWGVGHIFRSLEICKALAAHEIVMVVGGPEFDTHLPPHVRVFRLPGLMTDRNYSELFPTDRTKTLETVKSERQALLFQLFEKETPDVFVVELYPFGRKAFRFELDPVLEGIRNGVLRRSIVACSIRDILVEKRDPDAYEKRVVDTLNRWYDLVMIHADPKLVELDHTFSRMGDISIPVIYTGFISPKPPTGDRRRIRSALGIGEDDVFIVASAGGGQVGIVLLEPLLNCFPQLNTGRPVFLHVFTGPYMPDDEFDKLKKKANRYLIVERFTSDFLSLLVSADLSISMGGYNTCMNLLATRVPSLIWPYPGDREQGIRARRLAAIGAATVLKERNLQPHRLVEIIREKLVSDKLVIRNINLDGAVQTARCIEKSTCEDIGEHG
jgi:predicted glycosyltransferase